MKILAEKYNSFTEPFGLILTENQLIEITEKRVEALKKSGRVEFGEGITEDLIIAFRDSPYIYQGNFEETIIELQELFYYFKNECWDLLSDEELLFAMKRIFDEKAGGSTEFLAGFSGDEMINAYKLKDVREQEEDEYCD